jgi:hypothetical protein
MTRTEHDSANRQASRSRPAAYAHPRRIVQAFNGLIGEEIASKLLAEERFADRLTVLLADRSGLSDDFGDETPTPAAERLVMLSGSEIEALVRRIGAVYWARAIVGQIRASAVVAVKQVLGEDAHAAALAHRDLAASGCKLPGLEELGGAVTSAGLRCLAAWCARQPAGIATRARLKFPASSDLDDPLAPPFDELGPRIVERLLA